MSERKVLNKYYPPNFDPAKIPRVKRPKDAKLRHKVRLMAPFSMQCRTCGEYIYKGKKFNANKETVDGETYYSIRIFRFYIRCPKCHAEITFKTDPANLDYVAESGAVRNFEPWRDNEVVDDLVKGQRALEEELNPIKALENKTIDSKREMETLDQLDEMRMRNDRLHGVDVDQVLQQLISQDQRDAVAEEAELDRLAKEAFAGKRDAFGPNSNTAQDSEEEDADDDEGIPVDLEELMDQYRKSRASNAKQSSAASASVTASASTSKKRENEWAKLVAKKPKVATSQRPPGTTNVSKPVVNRATVQANSSGSPSQRQASASSSGSLPDASKAKSTSLVAAYGSDDDSDE